ncbi:DUF3800 domain-containing protein [Kitasatospora purpeofusca]|uniref:DUF3800 domain-containing protein n=1 Tax=Kitasatospora purpeofusca TaxID=67352 RepID=UPI0035E283DF
MVGNATGHRAASGLSVYVDETGDRGFGPRASAFFAMTAFLVPRERERHMRAIAAGLRADVRTGKPLHWVEHFKKKHADRRRLAADLLSGLPDAQVVHVVVHKDSAYGDPRLEHDNEAFSDVHRFYKYCCRLLLERVAVAAAGWSGGPREATLRLGHMRGMDHEDTLAYLERALVAASDTPWHLLRWPPRWTSTEAYDGVQLADLHAGFLNTALTGPPDDLGCASYLLSCEHQLVRHGRTGEVLGAGIDVVGDDSYLTKRHWWPQPSGLRS